MIGLIAGKSGDSLTDELHKRGYSVAIVCGKDNEPGVDKADTSLVADLSRHEEIYDFFSSHSICKVIFGTGHRLAFDLAEYLISKGFLVNIDVEKSSMAKDKWRFKKALNSINVNTPQAVIINSVNECERIETFGFPCVVKSVIDTVLPCKVDNVFELREAIAEVLKTKSQAFVEKYIDGNDCTVMVASDGYTVRNYGVTYYSKAKEYKLRGFNNAHSNRMTSKEERKVCEIAEKIVCQLQFKGLVRVDFIISDEVYVLELNSVIVTGYTGSAYPFFEKGGINVASLAIDTALSILNEK
ncbi:ATP-grasp domain-containing protein [Gallibacter sp. Marseille-QA0791]|uniref:ATP-grasp domain-containing protein n=1 Tax=Gallibacter sp. Marseille-QA0791 TaxID=3378781 RepID=UPI003D0C93E0